MTQKSKLDAATERARNLLEKAKWFGGLGGPSFQAKSKAYEDFDMLFGIYNLQRELERRFPIRPPAASESDQRRLFDEAMMGDSTSAHKLIETAIDCLMDDQAMPNVIRNYTIVTLLQSWRPIAKKSGKLQKNLGREFFIALTVDELQSFGFKPKRNKERKAGHESGCSIVARVLEERGAQGGRSEETVEGIWDRYQRRQKVRK